LELDTFDLMHLFSIINCKNICTHKDFVLVTEEASSKQTQ